jgi:glycosyltransferase involved in cell wall biosynthesis
MPAVAVQPDLPVVPDEKAPGAGLRVLLVAQAASEALGGEPMLPTQYFRRYRKLGVDVHLLCHERTADELRAKYPDDLDRLHFVAETPMSMRLFRIQQKVPIGGVLKYQTFHAARRGIARRQLVERAVDLVRRLKIDVVHEVNPVSPKEPSGMHAVREAGAALVIGPLNGGMTFPAGFPEFQSLFTKTFQAAGRYVSPLAHKRLPGKRLADLVLAANPRTRDALPAGAASAGGEVIELCENGVDLALWDDGGPLPADRPGRDPARPRFVYLGRLEGWKAVDLMIRAFAAADLNGTLDLIGDDDARPKLEALAEELGVRDRITFHGFKTQQDAAEIMRQCDVFCLSSLYECGGAVVLEAMAVGLPVITTDWGGPADYVDEHSAVSVSPTNREQFVKDFAAAMTKLGNDPALRRQMGAAGQRRIREGGFVWDDKIRIMLGLYQRAVVARRSGS